MIYNKEYIEQLLTRFMDGETSEQEEQILTDFFSANDSIPEEWEPYREMFASFDTDVYDFKEEELESFVKEEKPKTRTIRIWPWLAAACVVGLIIMISFWPNNDASAPQIAAISTKTENKVAPIEPEAKHAEKATPMTNAKAHVKKEVKYKAAPRIDEPVEYYVPVASGDIPEPLNENLHYASNEAKDTVPYQAPGKMNEFIDNLAEHYKVKGESITCTTDTKDSTTVCIAYVFYNTKELNLFNRLLQAACWYHNETPGYLLNYSHQQFFFSLKDMRLGLKYLWIAERVDNKILLYCTRAPINAEISSECFREYRDNLPMTTNFQKTKQI